MNRTRFALAGSLLALGLAGCSSTQSTPVAGTESAPVAEGLTVERHGHERHNVGYGDALGAAVFGQPVTVAKNEQFGDTRFAGAEDETMPGE